MKELTAAPDRPLHDDEGSLTLAPGWPPASPQPATENPYGNTRERLTNGTALAVKCQDSPSSKIGIRRQVRRNPQARPSADDRRPSIRSVSDSRVRIDAGTLFATGRLLAGAGGNRHRSVNPQRGCTPTKISSNSRTSP